MIFAGKIQIVSGMAGADPIASPGSVSQAQLINAGPLITQSGAAVCRRILLGLAASAAETVTISLYAADDSTMPGPNTDITPAVLAARRFFLIASGVVVTNGALAEIATLVPPGGIFYPRVTATTVVSPSALGIACGA